MRTNLNVASESSNHSKNGTLSTICQPSFLDISFFVAVPCEIMSSPPPGEMVLENAHLFATTEVQRIQERRLLHIVAAGFMVKESLTKKLAELESTALANFVQLVDNDTQVTPLMKVTMKKVSAGATETLKGSSIWRKFKSTKALLVNHMLPHWEFRSGDNELDALNRIRKQVWAMQQRNKIENNLKKAAAAAAKQATSNAAAGTSNEGVPESVDVPDIDPESCPGNFFCVELLTFKKFRSDPLLSRGDKGNKPESSSSAEDESGENPQGSRQVMSRRRQRLDDQAKRRQASKAASEEQLELTKAEEARKAKKEARKDAKEKRKRDDQEEKHNYNWVMLALKDDDLKDRASILLRKILDQKIENVDNRESIKIVNNPESVEDDDSTL